MKADNLIILKEIGLPVPPFFLARRPEDIDLSFSSARLFAVRSSFDAEDGGNASYAGQLETLINVDRDAVRDAFTKVYDSYKSSNIQTYQQVMNEDDSRASGMTVIVQEMVDSKISGVIFTANPLGILNEMVIVAGYGQGCNVVEDRIDTSSYYYNVTDEIYLRDGLDTTPFLSEEQIKLLVDYAVRIKEYFKTDMDIEYAIDGQNIYILQARPITTLGKGDVIILDNSNIVESYPGISLPATQSFVHEIYYKVFKALCERITGDKKLVASMDESLSHMTDAANGRIYYRISNWYTVLELLPFSKKIIAIWQEMLGVQQKSVSFTGYHIKLTTKLRLVCNFIYYLGKTPKLMAWLDSRFKQSLSGYQKRIEETSDTKELIELYEDIKEELTSVWDITLINDMCAFVYTALAGKKNKSRIASIKNLESMKPVEAMNTVISVAASSGIESEDYKKQKNIYISQYGDRITEELKLETKTYRTNPELLDEYVRLHIDEHKGKLSGADDNGHKAKKVYENFFIRRAKRAICDREISRLDRSRIFGIMRAIILKIGVNLTRQDYIDDVYDVFYLFYDEICNTEPTDYRDIIADRKVEYDSYTSIPAFSRLIFQGKVISKKLEKVTSHIVGKDVSQGVPVSDGRATGEVVVIEKASSDIDTRGKIIVTKMTDPGWVFLIKNCIGVVAEKGSLLSHTAIVTRELGKPAVVNVKDATSIFKDGDIVELDADTGVIRIIERAK